MSLRCAMRRPRTGKSPNRRHLAAHTTVCSLLSPLQQVLFDVGNVVGPQRPSYVVLQIVPGLENNEVSERNVNNQRGDNTFKIPMKRTNSAVITAQQRSHEGFQNRFSSYVHGWNEINSGNLDIFFVVW